MNSVKIGLKIFKLIKFNAVALTLLLFAGCGGSGDEVNIDYSQLKLAPIKDTKLTTKPTTQFSDYLKNGIRIRLGGSGPEDGMVALAAASDAGQTQTTFSTTNVHEVGVDESDRLKYDGEHLFLIEDSYFPYSESNGEYGIRIMETTPSEASASHVTRINRDQSEIPYDGIYLHQIADKKVLVSVAASRLYGWDAFWVGAGQVWESGKTEIQLHNITNPSAPELDWNIEIEGNLEGTRKIGNKLYLITRYVPNIQDLNYSAQTDAQKIANEKLIVQTPIQDLLPQYRINNGAVSSLVTPSDCLVADDLDVTEGYADVITITSINVDTQSIESSICLNANVHGIYSSTDNLYIGGSDYVAWQNFSEATVLHKFALENSGVEYRGSGWVKGSLGWSDPSFRMSEDDGYLRVVTSEHGANGPTHRLFVLSEGEQLQLEQVSQLPNEANPDPIGKPFEEIYAVRFVGSKAYIITFQQIDPLYEIDVSDPLNPVKVTELEMPGVARYLHPITDDWLLGIGQEVENGLMQGVKVELYDLRDKTAPQIKDTVIIGTRGSWSEAFTDLRSIGFLQKNGDERQLSMPINRYEVEAGQIYPTWADSGLHIFNINGIETNELSLTHAGALITETAGSVDYPMNWGVGRNTMDGESVYYYQGNQVWSALLPELENVLGPH